MNSLEKLSKRLSRAEAALDKELDRVFPIGKPVFVRRGRGVMEARVKFEAFRGRVKVESRTGNVHHVCWTDIE